MNIICEQESKIIALKTIVQKKEESEEEPNELVTQKT